MTEQKPFDDFLRSRRRKTYTEMPVTEPAGKASTAAAANAKVTHGATGISALAAFLEQDLKARQSRPQLNPDEQAKAALAFVARFYEENSDAQGTTAAATGANASSVLDEDGDDA
jgi:hypothetical protein